MATLSSLSASATSAPARLPGAAAPAASGRYCSPIASATGSGRPARACIDGTDVALELGELADEPRGLVRLGEPRRHEGVLARLRIARDLVCEHGDERLDARRLVGERPGAGVEADAAETAREALEPDLEVLRERERRVVETAADDALVARDRPSRPRRARSWRRSRSADADAPRASSSGKYRWWLCMTVMITRSGRSRNRSGNEPRSTLGHSARYTTSRMTPAGSAQPGCSASPCLDRLAALDLHRPSRTRRRTARARTRSRPASSTSPPRKRWPRDVRPERTPAELDLDDVAAMQADEPADRACEAQLTRLPQRMFLGNASPSTRPSHDLGQHLRGRSRIGVDLDEDEPVAAHERARRTCGAAARSPRRPSSTRRRARRPPTPAGRGARADRRPAPPARPLR